VDIEIRLFLHTYPDAFQVALVSFHLYSRTTFDNIFLIILALPQIKDMTNGMQYLKKIGIVHGDLKAVSNPMFFYSNQKSSSA
jgi:hypothetical protein